MVFHCPSGLLLRLLSWLTSLFTSPQTLGNACLLALMLKLGYVAKLPALIAFIHVAFVGNPAAAYMYMVLYDIAGSSNTWLIASVGSGWSMRNVSVFSFVISSRGFNGTLHNPLVLHQQPSNTALSDTTMFLQYFHHTLLLLLW